MKKEKAEKMGMAIRSQDKTLGITSHVYQQAKRLDLLKLFVNPHFVTVSTVGEEPEFPAPFAESGGFSSFTRDLTMLQHKRGNWTRGVSPFSSAPPPLWYLIAI